MSEFSIGREVGVGIFPSHTCLPCPRFTLTLQGFPVKLSCLAFAEPVDLVSQLCVVEIFSQKRIYQCNRRDRRPIGLNYRADRDLDTIENPHSSVVPFGHDILHALVPGVTDGR